MSSRKLWLYVAGALAVFATVLGVFLYNELKADTLPAYDQAIIDNAKEPLNGPAEEELKVAGYDLLTLKYSYITVQDGRTITVHQWYGGVGTTAAPSFFYTLDGKIVGVEVIQRGMRCDVPASSQSVRLIASDFQMYEARQQGRVQSGRYFPYEPEFPVLRDGGTITYYCN